MTLYETIFTRRAVRQYDKTPLEDAELAEIQQVLDGAKRLPGQSGRFEIVNADKLKNASSPHAILAFSDDTDAARANIGYTLQTLDLYLQSKGYGSLWMGMAKPVTPQDDYRILLAFGKTDTPPRSSAGDFKRRAVLQISNEDNDVARAARLAPSAVNFQPWKLEFAPGKVTVRYVGRGLGKLVTLQFQKIDIGIILKHVELVLEHEDKTVTGITPKGSGKSFAVEVAYA
ncbi:MAG: hypothetical protein LBO63_05635 [Oscillospiraceae bacterium]|nr:hypothetical protein [Oscillospiraceae bacterium]